MALLQLLLLLACVAAAAAAAARATTAVTAAAPMRVIIDTDIGRDFDDSWALALALSRPDLWDVRLVLTATDDTVGRARVTAKYLRAFGRARDIPIGVGVQQTGRGGVGALGSWARDVNLTQYVEEDGGTVHYDGVAAAAAILAGEPNVTIIGLAPMVNMAALAKRFPQQAARVEHIYAMFGAIHVCYGGRPIPPGGCAEYNVNTDRRAAQDFLHAWPGVVVESDNHEVVRRPQISITPLDTCGNRIMDGAPWERLRAANGSASSPMVSTLLTSLCYWAARAPWWKGQGCTAHSDVLYDPTAMFMSHPAYRKKALSFTDIPIVVTDRGDTVIVNSTKTPGAATVAAALHWRYRGISDFYNTLVDDIIHGQVA